MRNFIKILENRTFEVFVKIYFYLIILLGLISIFAIIISLMVLKRGKYIINGRIKKYLWVICFLNSYFIVYSVLIIIKLMNPENQTFYM